MNGKLYLVGTPIGNLSDITLRALETLKSVDYIACEDTRHTLGLLNRYEIKKPLISYYKGKEREGGQKIAALVTQGKNVALVSDAGMPCISDPGSELVAMFAKEGLEYTVIPGPSAVISAVSLIGLDGAFTFLGFLPAKNKDKDKFIAPYIDSPAALIFYAAPHDLNDTLLYLYSALGQRKAYLVKEITKIYENVQTVTLDGTVVENPRGEYVIIVDGKPQEKKEISAQVLIAELKSAVESGVSKKEAAAALSQKYGIAKNAAYKLTIDL